MSSEVIIDQAKIKKVVDFIVDKIDQHSFDNLPSYKFNKSLFKDAFQFEAKLIDGQYSEFAFYYTLTYEIDEITQKTTNFSVKGKKSYFYHYFKLAILKKILSDYQNSNIKNARRLIVEDNLKELEEKFLKLEFDETNEDPALISMIYSLDIDIMNFHKEVAVLRFL